MHIANRCTTHRALINTFKKQALTHDFILKAIPMHTLTFKNLATAFVNML